MQDLNSILNPEQFYHIYNRANGNDKLFKKSDNYLYFLLKYKLYILPIADLYAYCLMPNHFHFLIQVKSETVIEKLLLNHKQNAKYNKTLQGFETLAGLERQKIISSYLTKQWSNLFNSYTQAYNKQNNRQGSLFMRNYKRKKIGDEHYLKKLIHYIHYNPVKAGLTSEPKKWDFSSYRSVLSNKPTNLMREEVIALFDDLENFKSCHVYSPNLSGIDKYF